MTVDTDGNITGTELGKMLKGYFDNVGDSLQSTMSLEDFIEQLKRNPNIRKIITEQAQQYVTEFYKKELRKIR